MEQKDSFFNINILLDNHIDTVLHKSSSSTKFNDLSSKSEDSAEIINDSEDLSDFEYKINKIIESENSENV